MSDSLMHIVKTSAQWEERSIKYLPIPRGCLCVELTASKKTKIKIGEGDKYYSLLPYVDGECDLSQYYTKEEINNLLNNLNRMAIMSTEEYPEKEDLPLVNNKLGDVRFVKSSSPSLKLDPDIYLWNGHKWIFVGYDLVDIDLSQFIKREEFEPIVEKVNEMYPKMHTHENKDILDRVEEPYTTAEKDKLESLENYDDTEIRGLIRQATHVHPNKSILDQIEKPFKTADKEKLDSLENYDDTDLRNRVTAVESTAHTHSNKAELDSIYSGFVDEHEVLVEFKTIAENEIDSLQDDVADLKTKIHTHSNKNILDSTTAPYTREDKQTLTDLANITVFDGASATYDGFRGYVPAPHAGEQSYFLRGDGIWAKVKSGSGDKYKAGDGIFILSGEVISDAFPFKVYSKSGHLSKYIIYGNTGGVGESMGGGVYGVNISVTDEHGNTNNTSIILPEKISFGDYIDYEKQVFVHMRTNVSSLVNTVDPNYRYRWAIRSNGNISPTDVGAYGSSPQVTTLVELEPGTTYELYHECSYPAFSNYMNLNVYDVDQNRTRTMNFYDSTGKVPTIIALGPNEKYIRLTWEHCDWYPNTLIKVKAVETPTTLPQIPLFPNSINTINVTNTIKPAEIYVEVAEPSEDDPDDPMSEYTGIIYNEGVLDITQEDPNALNELTVHFRESDKVITVPTGNTYTAGGGIDIDANDEISAKLGSGLQFDANGAIEVTGGGGGDSYVEGQGIEFTPDPRSAELPNTYQQIEYLQGTGTQGIILNYTPMSTTPTDIKYELTYSDLVSEPTGWHYLIGGWLESSHKMPPSIVYSNNNYQDKLVLSICEADIITNGDWPTGNTVHTSIVTIDGSTAKMQLDNGTESSGTWSGSIDHALAIFASNRGSGTLGSFSAYKFRELKIYENDILIHHYYPCYRKSDNEPGIYDVITNTFLTNDGTGDFICGNDVNYDDTFINVKLGTGLHFDTNDAIAADKYLAGQGIEIGYHEGIVVTNPEYYFDTQVTCALNGSFYREFTKTTDEPALGALINCRNSGQSDSWTGPIFVGPTASSVKCSYNTDNVVGPFTYKGRTWFSTGTNYWVDGSLTDSNNHLPRIPGQDQNVVPDDINDFTVAKMIIDAAGFVDSNNQDISAKLGNGLSFDSNDAIQADQMTGATALTNGASGIVPAPLAGDNAKFLRGDGSWAEIETSTKYTEGDAIEFGHPGMTDLGFNFDTFVSKFTQPNNGTVSVDSANKAFTLTATGSDCYTSPWTGGSLYTIPVIGGRKYRLTWNSNAPNVAGLIYAFENADTSHMHSVNQAVQNYLEFIANTNSNINFRFGVRDAGNSITFSNIKFYEVDNADPDTNIINVKYGNGLSLDNNNALQVDGMVGATSQANGESGTVPQPLIADKDKFLKGDGTWSDTPTYTLPIASDTTLGGIKVGNNLTIDQDGVLSASLDEYQAGEGIDIIGTTRPIDINYIRLDINNSRDNGSGHIIQFKNIRVLDTNGNSLQFSHASSIYGDGSAVEYGQNTRDESPQAMIEGRNKTCCTNFSLTKAPLKITFTLTTEISIANITSFSILTGADYTTRDPVSWDIYASNDGVTWYKIQEAHSPDVTTARSTWITNIPFVIPPDAVEVLPGTKTINAKIGDGLSFDQNDAITVDEMVGASTSTNGSAGSVPAPSAGDENKFLRGDGTWQTVSGGTQYQAGQGIEIETDTVTTYENLHFDYYAFKDKIQGVLNGSISFDIPNHALTISATNNYCYVFPDRESDGQLYKIPVEPNEDYLLTWEVNDTTIAGKVDVFENGNVTVGHYDPAGRESAASQQFLFTTSSTAETIHIRPYVYDAGTSLTFSNFQLYHVIYDASGKIINAKLGNGLDFDSNDAIEVKLGTGLQFDSNGAIETTGGETQYEAGTGISIVSDSGSTVSRTLKVNAKTAQANDYTIYGATGGVGEPSINLMPQLTTSSIWADTWYADGTHEGKPAFSKNTWYGGITNEVYLTEGTYTFSMDVKLSSTSIQGLLANELNDQSRYPHYNQAATVNVMHYGPFYPVDTDWHRYSYTFEVTTAGYVACRAENVSAEHGTISVARPQLERGSVAHDYIEHDCYTIPIIISAPNETDIELFIETSAPLGNGDSINFIDDSLTALTLYQNKVNTVTINTTVAPSRFSIDASSGSDVTSIIENDGILDVTQEDPNALNELTFHFRDNVDKTLTIPSETLVPATTTTLGGVKVGAGLSMNANDEIGVTSPYVTSVANQGSVPGVITVAKSDGTSTDVDVLDNMRLILNCNYDSSLNRTQLGEPVNAPVAANKTLSSVIENDLTILEV